MASGRLGKRIPCIIQYQLTEDRPKPHYMRGGTDLFVDWGERRQRINENESRDQNPLGRVDSRRRTQRPYAREYLYLKRPLAPQLCDHDARSRVMSNTVIDEVVVFGFESGLLKFGQFPSNPKPQTPNPNPNPHFTPASSIFNAPHFFYKPI